MNSTSSYTGARFEPAGICFIATVISLLALMTVFRLEIDESKLYINSLRQHQSTYVVPSADSTDEYRSIEVHPTSLQEQTARARLRISSEALQPGAHFYLAFE